MIHKPPFRAFLCLVLLFLKVGIFQTAAEAARGFTYQGQLRADGTNANGVFPLVIKLYDASSAGNQIGAQISTNTSVLNGLFSVTLDFGDGAFDGNSRWLEIAIANVILSPRQAITPAPYALYSAKPTGVANAITNLFLGSGSNVWTFTEDSSGALILSSPGSPGSAHAFVYQGVSSSISDDTDHIYVTGAGEAGVNGSYSYDLSAARGQLAPPIWTNSFGTILSGGGDMGTQPWTMVDAAVTRIYYTNMSTDLSASWQVDVLDTPPGGSPPAPSSVRYGTNNITNAVVVSDGSITLAGSGAFYGNLAGGTNLNGSSIQIHTITANQIADAAITGVQLAAGSVSSAKLSLGSVPMDRLDNTAWIELAAAQPSRYLHVNRYGYTNVINKIKNGKTIRVMFAGGGLTEYMDSWLLTWFYPRFPLAGMGTRYQSAPSLPPAPSFFTLTPTAGAYYTNGASVGALYFPYYMVMPSPGAVCTSSLNGVHPTGNVFEIAYLRFPGGGSFRVQTNINNGAWRDLPGYSNVDSSAPEGITNAVIIKWTNSVVAQTGLRTFQISGLCYILAGAFYDTTINGGIVPLGYTSHGTSWGAMLNGGTNTYIPILQSWSPDLILLNMPSDQYANEMAWISSVITYLPDAYIVGVGLQPLNGEPTLAAQNTVLRDICRTNRFSYFDTFGVFGDVTNMTSRGFSDGSIHPSASGWKAWTDLLWNWLDLNP